MEYFDANIYIYAFCNNIDDENQKDISKKLKEDGSFIEQNLDFLSQFVKPTNSNINQRVVEILKESKIFCGETIMSNKPLTKKIVAGRFKNRVLQLPSMQTTRSSKSIVLESFFNTLQFDIVDATFVEVFSGSGSIGLEALSRGASKVLFMERDKDVIKVLNSNIAQTDPLSCKVFAGDSFKNIQEVVALLQKQKLKAYFYIDPPFHIREGMEEIYEQMINMIKSIPTEVVELIIIEHISELKIDDNLNNYKKLKSKKFGKTTLTYFKDVI